METIDKTSEFYPENLKEIKDSPNKLYVLGNLYNLNTRCISIIGSRKCTEYGKKQGEKFAFYLAKQGITIVSGMAIRNRCIGTYGSTKSMWKNNCSSRLWI